MKYLIVSVKFLLKSLLVIIVAILLINITFRIVTAKEDNYFIKNADFKYKDFNKFGDRFSQESLTDSNDKEPIYQVQ